MKTLLIILLGTLAIKMEAQKSGNAMANSAHYAEQQQMGLYEEQQSEMQEQAMVLANEQAKLNAIYSRDTWRVIDGKTNLNRGPDWYEFQGQAKEYKKEGILFKGRFGPIMTIEPEVNERTKEVMYGEESFLIENFPYPAENENFQYMTAHEDGTFTFTNHVKQVVTIPKFDYGKPCQKIWSPEEIAAAQKKITDKKKAITDRVLKSNQDLADKGDPYGLMRMGERYRDGDGVQKDLIKAMDYLQKAADAGSDTASNELSTLKDKPQ